MCVGARGILADLLPNMTLRDAINRILEPGSSSSDKQEVLFDLKDVESARCPQPRISSLTPSAASKGTKWHLQLPLPLPQKCLCSDRLCVKGFGGACHWPLMNIAGSNDSYLFCVTLP